MKKICYGNSFLSSTQEGDTASDEVQAPVNEDEARRTEVAPETEPDEITAAEPTAGTSKEGTISSISYFN